MAVNGDNEFDSDLRRTLDELAPDHAPDRLISRVASIPAVDRAPAPARFSLGVTVQRFASAAAAIAAVVLIAIAAFLSRGGPGPSVGTSPNAATPSVSVPASTTPASSQSPSPSTPSPSLRPGPPAGSVPSGFSAVSATFVSPAEGFVLGTVPCASGRCPAILRTTDAGSSWGSIPAPSTSVSTAPVEASGAGISGLRFANALDGWAWGPELWATHDGGGTWRRVTIGGFGSVWGVVALEAGNGSVHAVVYDGQQRFRLATAAVGGDQWQVSAISLAVGAGPVPTVQLVLSGSGGWAIENDRTVVAGARLVGGTWQAWVPPCLKLNGPAVLAASSGQHIVAACNVGLWSTPQGEHLFVSNDGGATFTETGSTVPVDAQQVTAANASITVVAGSGSNGSVLVGSFDGGRTWVRVSQPASAVFADLGFTTVSQGIVIRIPDGGGTGELLMTHDGGRTWSPVRF